MTQKDNHKPDLRDYSPLSLILIILSIVGCLIAFMWRNLKDSAINPAVEVERCQEAYACPKVVDSPD